jgi:hypothetical protein
MDLGKRRAGGAPTVEARSRGGRIEPRGRRDAVALAPVLARVEKDVGQRVSHLARGLQHMQVVAVGEDWTAAAEGPVDRPGEPGTDRLHPAGEVARIRGLDEKVHVVSLEGIVNDAEATAFAALAQAPLPLAHQAGLAQGRDAAPDPERDVAREARGER